MTREEFRRSLAEALGTEPQELPDDRRLESLPAWDSLSQLGVIALIIDAFDVQPNLPQLADCQTVSDVISLVADRLSEPE